MPEKFEHQEYRDQLAKDLGSIEDHGDRRKALKSEKESWRYKLANERHIKDAAALRGEKAREEICAELDEMPIEDIIESHPEFAEKIEAIRLEKEGWEISLVRDKMVPELAFPVWSKSKHRGGTLGAIELDVPEPRLKEGSIRMEFRSVCACCSSEARGLESPFKTNYPKYQEYKGHDGESAEAVRAIQSHEFKKYEKEIEQWKKSTEGQKDAKWQEEIKRKYKEVMQNACTQNGIKYLAMRLRDGEKVWDEHYGKLNGVKMLEIAEPGWIRENIKDMTGYKRKDVSFRFGS